MLSSSEAQMIVGQELYKFYYAKEPKNLDIFFSTIDVKFFSKKNRWFYFYELRHITTRVMLLFNKHTPKLTSLQLSQEINVPIEVLHSLIIRCSLSKPQKLIKKLAKFFKVDYDFLLYGTTKKKYFKLFIKDLPRQIKKVTFELETLKTLEKSKRQAHQVKLFKEKEQKRLAIENKKEKELKEKELKLKRKHREVTKLSKKEQHQLRLKALKTTTKEQLLPKVELLAKSLKKEAYRKKDISITLKIHKVNISKALKESNTKALKKLHKALKVMSTNTKLKLSTKQKTKLKKLLIKSKN